jgi:hypothetical protein
LSGSTSVFGASVNASAAAGFFGILCMRQGSPARAHALYQPLYNYSASKELPQQVTQQPVDTTYVSAILCDAPDGTVSSVAPGGYRHRSQRHLNPLRRRHEMRRLLWSRNYSCVHWHRRRGVQWPVCCPAGHSRPERDWVIQLSQLESQMLLVGRHGDKCWCHLKLVLAWTVAGACAPSRCTCFLAPLWRAGGREAPVTYLQPNQVQTTYMCTLLRPQ